MSPQGDEQLCRPFLCFVPYFNSRLRKETNDADYAERGTLCDFNSRLCQGDEQHLQVYQRMEIIQLKI